jgi:hypothetical protein
LGKERETVTSLASKMDQASWERRCLPGVLKDIPRDQSRSSPKRKPKMSDSRIKEHMEVIGADGVHVGTVDGVEGGRIKLTKADSGEGQHKGHHHFIDLGLVAGVEGQKVRLSANAAVAVTLEEEGSSKPV